MPSIFNISNLFGGIKSGIFSISSSITSGFSGLFDWLNFWSDKDPKGEVVIPTKFTEEKTAEFHKEIKKIQGPDLKKIERLIEEGVDVNSKDENGNSAILWCVGQGNVSAVELLLGRGAKSNYVDSETGSTLLHIAADRGKYEMVRYLMDNTTIDINAKTKPCKYNDGHTAAGFAMGNTDYKIALEIIQREYFSSEERGKLLEGRMFPCLIQYADTSVAENNLALSELREMQLLSRAQNSEELLYQLPDSFEFCQGDLDEMHGMKISNFLSDFESPEIAGQLLIEEA